VGLATQLYKPHGAAGATRSREPGQALPVPACRRRSGVVRSTALRTVATVHGQLPGWPGEGLMLPQPATAGRRRNALRASFTAFRPCECAAALMAVAVRVNGPRRAA
jgi:hypothetical protein